MDTLPHEHFMPEFFSKSYASTNSSKGLWGVDPTGLKSVLTYFGPSDKEPGSGWKRRLVEIAPDTTWGPKGTLHSQVGQDWLVASILGCKSNGYFVDLAANHPSRGSNSLMLERDFKWNGICVEPNPKYLPMLAKRRCRTVEAVVGSPTDTLVNFTVNGNALGGIVGDQYDNHDKNVPTKSYRTVALSKILQDVGAPPVIDYFSLDVEGAESLIMADFPWDSYTFRVLTVERPNPSLRKSLLGHGYHFLRRNSDLKSDDETWIHQTLLDLTTKSIYQNGMASEETCMTKIGHPWPKDLEK